MLCLFPPETSRVLRGELRWFLRMTELLGPESGKAPVSTLDTKFDMGQFALSFEIKS